MFIQALKKILIILSISAALAYFAPKVKAQELPAGSSSPSQSEALNPSRSDADSDKAIKDDVTAAKNQDRDDSDHHRSWRSDFGGDRSMRPGIFPGIILMFVLLLVLGRNYFREKTEQRRLDLLTAMIAKGQPVPEAVVSQILGNSGRNRGHHRHHRNPVAFQRRAITCLVIAAGLLIVHFTQVSSSHHQHYGFLVPGIILLGIGLGNLFTIKAQERYLNSLPPEKE